MFAFIRHIFQKHVGLDHAIAASSLTQLMRFVTGPITMFLMIRHLTPEEQGFFYSFGGVVGLQIFLEAGFAQSIIQFTSKEFADLRFTSSGALTGSPAALSRLRSLLSQANRYYRTMAIVMILALSLGGYWFFSSKPSYDVPWSTPWFIVCVCAGVGFIFTPFWALLEGCNRVAQVATYRMWSTLAIFLIVATGLMLDLGIYVTAWVSVFNLIIPITYLVTRWRRLLIQVLRPPGTELIFWRKDVWSFQWRNALAWFGGYVLSGALSPMAFSMWGPVVAGQVGMVMQVTRMGCGIASTWSATKIPQLGVLHARADRKAFERIWLFGAKRHILVAFSYQITFLLGLYLLEIFLPTVAQRMLSLQQAAGISIGTAIASLILVYAHYGRACRVEIVASINTAMAVGVLLGTYCLGLSYGPLALGLSFTTVHLVAALLTRSIWKQRLSRLWPLAQASTTKQTQYL